MPSPLSTIVVATAAQRLPLLRRVPLARLVIVTELAILAKSHYERLSPAERRRLVLLLRQARLQPRNMTDRNRREFMRIVAKLEPELFARTAVERFSPTSRH